MLSTELVDTATGLKVRGEFRAPAVIYNMRIDFYARDPWGLLVDDTSAYPFDHDTITAGTLATYDSFPFHWHKGEIAGLVHVVGFIEGPAPANLSSSIDLPGGELPPEVARNQTARARTERYDAERARLEAP